MSIKRAYGRIIWQKHMPVFQMVNQQAQQFTIYAEPLINLYRKFDKFVRIKRKDNRGNQKTGYYLGEIYGRLEEYEYDEKKYCKLTLHIGSPYQTMQLNTEGTELSDVIEQQEYWFPEDELVKFIECLDVMVSQNNHFTLSIMNTEIISPVEKSLLPSKKLKKNK